MEYERFLDTATEEEAVEACRGADAVITCIQPFPKSVIERLTTASAEGLLVDRKVREGNMHHVGYLSGSPASIGYLLSLGACWGSGGSPRTWLGT